MRSIIRKIFVMVVCVSLLPVSCLCWLILFVGLKLVNAGDKDGFRRDMRYVTNSADEGCKMWEHLYRGE